MSPEDWRTYWRTAALTPHFLLYLERSEESTPDWQTAKIDACIDSMELQMLRIKP